MFEGAALSFFFNHLPSFFLRAFLVSPQNALSFFFLFDSPLFSRGRFAKFLCFLIVWPLVLTQAWSYRPMFLFFVIFVMPAKFFVFLHGKFSCYWRGGIAWYSRNLFSLEFVILSILIKSFFLALNSKKKTEGAFFSRPPWRPHVFFF